MSDGIITIENIGEEWRATTTIIAPVVGATPETGIGDCENSALTNLDAELAQHASQDTVTKARNEIKQRLG